MSVSDAIEAAWVEFRDSAQPQHPAFVRVVGDLLRSQAWVPWNVTAEVPERGAYVVTCEPQDGISSRYRKVLRADHELWRDWEVVAYLPQPLPAPYQPKESE